MCILEKNYRFHVKFPKGLPIIVILFSFLKQVLKSDEGGVCGKLTRKM